MLYMFYISILFYILFSFLFFFFFFFLNAPPPPDFPLLPHPAPLPSGGGVRRVSPAPPGRPHPPLARARVEHAALPGVVPQRPGPAGRPVLARRGAAPPRDRRLPVRSEEHTSELQSQSNLVCRLLLEKK